MQSVTTIETLESKSTSLQHRVQELETELQITKDSTVPVEVVQELEKVKRERDDLTRALQTTEEDFDSLRIERDQLQKQVEELEVEVTTGVGIEGEDGELAVLKRKHGDLDEGTSKAATFDGLQERISQHERCEGEADDSAPLGDDLKARVAVLEARLEESETKRKEAEYALSYRRDYSETSFDGDRTRDSILSFTSFDTDVSSRLGFGGFDPDSEDKRSLATVDTAPAIQSPVDPDLISSPISMKATDSNDFKKRAEQAEKEVARLRTLLHDGHKKKLDVSCIRST